VAEPTLKLRFSLGDSGAFIRFYGELNDFLTPQRRGRLIPRRFDVPPSVKDAIESLGVPHPEVGLIVVNTEPSPFSRLLQRGDFVSVYPAFHSIDIGSLPPLRPPLEGRPRLVLDVHLGRLAAYLRLMGFDTLYRTYCGDPELAAISVAERRILLTRDRGLLKRAEVIYGYWVRHTEPRKQLLEIVRRYDLTAHVDLFSRCLVCNGPLVPVSKEEVRSHVPPRALVVFNEFHSCAHCERVYWKGSHYRRMMLMMGRLLRTARGVS
jgi:uncharacterized protein